MLQSHIPPGHPVLVRGFTSNLAGRVPYSYLSIGKGEGPSDFCHVSLRWWPSQHLASDWVQQPHWSVKVPACQERCCGQVTQALWPNGVTGGADDAPRSHGSDPGGIGIWPPQTHLLLIPFKLISQQSRPRNCQECQGSQNYPFMVLRKSWSWI